LDELYLTVYAEQLFTADIITAAERADKSAPTADRMNVSMCMNSHTLSSWVQRKACRDRQRDPSLRSGWQGWTLLLDRNCHVHLNHALLLLIGYFTVMFTPES